MYIYIMGHVQIRISPAYLTYMPVVLKLVQINTAVLQFVINIEQILFTGVHVTDKINTLTLYLKGECKKTLVKNNHFCKKLVTKKCL
jgi:hypothetical protein